MIRIGSRGSDLALWQARHVAALLGAAGEACEIIVLVTRGDRIDDVPLQSVEGKGFFTKELEDALLEGRIDLAVHSHKDLPSEAPPGLVIAAVPARASAGERLLVAPAAHAPEGLFLPLARGARVGTSAPRRTAQLAALRPDLRTESLRGNVPTRVRRLREGRYDAIVLAAAGLERLGLDLDGIVDVPLPPEGFVPAPAQGALAIQTRAEDAPLRALLVRALHDEPAAEAVAAERSLLVRLGGGCNLPLGVHVVRTATGRWRAQAFLGAGHPRPENAPRWCQAEGADPAAAARAAGARLLEGAATGQGPLAGRRIAVAGSRSSLAELEPRLAVLGAEVVREAWIEVEDLSAPELAPRVAALAAGDWLCVTSANAARRLADVTLGPGVRLAAVGAATARVLAASGRTPDTVGDAGAAALAAGLEVRPGTRVLFPCAEGAREELEQVLTDRGARVERLVLYRTRPGSADLDPRADVRLYLSPSSVAAALEAERALRPRARRVALGPSTAEALAAADLPHVAAASPDPEDVLEALVRAALAPPDPESQP